MWAHLFKQLKNRLLFIVIPFLGQLLIRFLYATNRKKIIIPDASFDQHAIYVYWHGSLLMQSCFIPKMQKQKREWRAIISEHKDGEFIAKTLKSFGLGNVRGSSSRGGAKALLQAMTFVKNGGNLVITPDGPRGPRHSVANGVVIIAQKLNLPIIVQNVVPSKYWRLKSWDQFILPKPFGTLNFIVSKPFSIQGLNLEDAKRKIRSRMMEHAL